MPRPYVQSHQGSGGGRSRQAEGAEYGGAGAACQMPHDGRAAWCRGAELDWYYKALVAADAPIPQRLKSEALARVKVWRHLADEGAAAIAAAAAAGDMPRLKKLVLAHNQIGDAGMQALASALPGPSSSLLFLQGNNIGDAGLAARRGTGEGRAAGAQGAVLCFYNIGDAGVKALVGRAICVADGPVR